MRAVDIAEDAGFHPVEAVNADGALSILGADSDISVLFTDIHAGQHGRLEAGTRGS
ncbi:MAG: signal transduction histidine kinase [Acidimicrobiales bacterium]|nr:signal transduction histidine kinase [Acidimicrobiales bacterium]